MLLSSCAHEHEKHPEKRVSKLVNYVCIRVGFSRFSGSIPRFSGTSLLRTFLRNGAQPRNIISSKTQTNGWNGKWFVVKSCEKWKIQKSNACPPLSDHSVNLEKYYFVHEIFRVSVVPTLFHDSTGIYSEFFNEFYTILRKFQYLRN